MRTIITTTTLSLLCLFSHAQNVGIGTTTPTSARLVISGTAAQEGLDLSSTDQYANLRVIRNSLGSDKDMYLGLGSGAASSLHLYSNNAETITLKEGNAGIGISTPTYKLHVGSSNNSVRIEGPAISGGVALSVGGFGDLQIDKPGTAGGRFIVKDNGNVGIGTSAPNASLQFSNNTANRKIVFYEAANNDHQFNGFGLNAGLLRYQVNSISDDHVFYAGTSATTSNELFRIKGNGALAVSGNTGTAKQILSSNGNSAATWTTASSIIQTGISGETTNVDLTGSVLHPLQGSIYSITLAVPSRVILSYKSTTYKFCAVGDCSTKWLLIVYLNGNPMKYYYPAAQSYGGEFINFLTDNTNGPDYFDLGTGTYIFTFNAASIFNEPTIKSFSVISTIIPL